MQPVQYHIVKFTFGLPYPSCSGYECVPQSWVTYHEPKKSAAIIAYPNRAVNPIADDLKNAKRYAPNWNTYAVKVIFSTENYDEAQVCLQLFQSDTSNTSPEETDTDCVTIIETPQPTPKVVLPPAEVPEQSQTHSTPNTPTQTRARSEQVSKLKRRPGPKSKTIKEPEIARDVLLSDIDHEALQRLEEIEALFNNTQELSLKLKVTDKSILTKQINTFLKNSHQSNVTVNNDDTLKSKLKRTKTPPVRYTNGTSDRSKKSIKKSIWTVRYPKLKPGLVKLIPEYNVYVKKKNLDKYLTATECSDLARALLCEMFSDEALLQCSLFGTLRGSNPRPGLDSYARTVLFLYLDKCRTERNWTDWTDLRIKKCLYKKLQQIKMTRVIGNSMLDE